MTSPATTAIVGVAALLIGGAAGAWIVSSQRAADLHTAALGPPNSREGLASYVPLGDMAGSAKALLPAFIDNPIGQNATAVADGNRLFERLNCAGCHGYGAKGGMGPDLTDKFWRYGGTPVQIYKSIYEGRPKGMPAWGRALPARSIWELTAYVQSLGGSFPAQAYHAGLQGDAQASPGRAAEKTGTSGLPEGQ